MERPQDFCEAGEPVNSPEPIVDSTRCPSCGWEGPPQIRECPRGCREGVLNFSAGAKGPPRRLWTIHRRERESVWIPPEHYAPIRTAESAVKLTPRTKVEAGDMMALVSLLGLRKRN